MNRDTRLVDLTQGQLEDLIRSVVEQTLKRVPRHKEMPEYAQGNKGLAVALGCSVNTANRISRNPRFASAKHQESRGIIWNLTEVKNILKN